MSELTFFKAVNVNRLTVPVSADAIRLAFETQPESENLYHVPPTKNQLSTFGFCSQFTVKDLVPSSNWVISYLHSERKVNMTAVSQDLVKAKAAFKEAEGVEMTKNEADAQRDELIVTAMIHAPIVETRVKLYYHSESQLLICDHPKLGPLATGLLLKLLGTLTTETIHITGISNTLAKTLLSTLTDAVDLAIGRFGYGSKLDLKAPNPEDKRRAKFREDYYHDHIIDLLGEGFVVDLVRLDARGVSFDLTHDFKIKTIAFEVTADYEEAEEMLDREEYEDSIQSYQLDLMANAIMDLATVLQSQGAALEAAANAKKGK